MSQDFQTSEYVHMNKSENLLPQKPRFDSTSRVILIIGIALLGIGAWIFKLELYFLGGFLFLLGLAAALLPIAAYVEDHKKYSKELKKYEKDPDKYVRNKAKLAEEERKETEIRLVEIEKRRKELAEKMKEEERKNKEIEAARLAKLPSCPICGKKKHVVKISTANRYVSVTLVGLASSKIGKQYECKNCNHYF